MSELGAKQSASNLDLTNVDDPTQLAIAIEGFYKSDSATKTQLAYNWERNSMYLDGKQWIVYDGDRATGGIWKPLQVSKANEYIPRPVTNYFYDAFQTLKGYLLKTKPRISVRPNSNTHKDKSASKLATLVSETNYERLKEDANYEYAAACLITYGTVLKKSYWDTSSIQQAEIPQMQVVPKTDPMTGMVIGEEEVPVLDELGQPVMNIVPIGDVNTDVIEPFRICIDPLANDLHKARWIMEYAIQPLDWIQETYGKEAEGYTGRIDELKAEPSLNNSMRRFLQLKTSSGVKGGAFSSEGASGADASLDNTAVVKEYYEKPSLKYPKGRLVVVANGIPLYVGDSPCEGPDLGDWHPYSECRWEIVPGRFWGKSPLDDGADIQKAINSIDAVITLTRKTMAIPQKLIPLGIGIEPGSWTGRPGLEKFYRADGTGSKPEIIPSQGVHESVFAEREQKLEDFKQITGAIDILKGDRPPGVTAASALSMLYEVGTGKLFPVLDRWKSFVEGDQKKQLRLIAKNFQEPREDFIRLLQSKNSELSEEEINNFIGQDLHDNCNVIIEAGSHVPKLKAAEQALLLEVANTGSLALEQPANRREFNERLGIMGFDNDVGPDMKRAEWENDLLDNLPQAPDNKPVVLFVDKHDVHMECHANRMKEPSFMSLAPEVQKAYMTHYQEHEMMKEQAEMMAQMNAMAVGSPPPPPAPGPNEPSQPIEGAGKGVPTSVSKALFSDALSGASPGIKK